MKSRLINLIVIMILNVCYSTDQPVSDYLVIKYSGDADLEVGGPFVGLAFHNSYMIPQRISFYYPVANSIDQSQDYWTRDTSFTMNWILQIDDENVQSLGRTPVPFEFTPYAVTFSDTGNGYVLTADYRFCEDKPAMVQTLILENTTNQKHRYRFDYFLKTSLRTSHSYKFVDYCEAELDSIKQTVYSYFDDTDTRQVCVFVSSAGLIPNDMTCNEPIEKPFTGLFFDQILDSGESLEFVFIIGSADAEEVTEIKDYLLSNYAIEIQNYENNIKEKIFTDGLSTTGDLAVDHSMTWAKAMMEVNQHYLDGEIVPMPCPAEYNFYFSHDALVTNLATVYFDIERVKNDLLYIISHTNHDKILPHAYYWKDGRYITEYASSDNWNNFWFIQLVASYLRHSGDIEFTQDLFPYVTKSLDQALLNLEEDDLMWSYRPDWWDIGNNYGPRSYMTILAIKAIRDYIYLSSTFKLNTHRLQELDRLVSNMQKALTDKLWDSEMGYLVNYHNDGSLDEHYYIGSLLAVYFDLLDDNKSDILINTAKSLMVVEKLGIYNVYPMDFENLGEYLQFSGNEAGAQYYYFNGGIWPQGNAWYALALIARDRRQEAAAFINRTMSLHGIWHGPGGQPAYYEVRNANSLNRSEYGKVDKPQFLWAGAWYLYSQYNLFGVRENSWNISLDPFLKNGQESNQFTLFVNGNYLHVTVSGQGNTVAEMTLDGITTNSTVLPTELEGVSEIDILLGEPSTPYLASTKGKLNSCTFSEGILDITVSAYEDFQNEMIVISQFEPTEIRLGGKILKDGYDILKGFNHYRTILKFSHTEVNADLQIII